MIIGITGTLGAGKGAAVEYLVGRKGFTHFWARAFFVEEIERRGLPVNRDTMTHVANELRATHGAEHFVKESLAKIDNQQMDAVVESIRTVGEAEYLKKHGAVLWAIDADREVRYHRVVDRASETDKVTFEEFVAHEERELHNDDPTKQNIAKVMAMADHVFHSNGTKEELYVEVEEALKEAQSKGV
jgi:dephospho-CoA kinase